ncbi:hypothetical protein VTK73DRAFT_643 [Phialemonium thermophilum]|uniref:Cupin 2 conserved barrel domain-containing protein n=1 Tax=Phialemonium thermophilum TaxID=223376 RepID=A0ABR3XDE9_9PEZI
MATDPRPPTENQLAPDLPGPVTYLTGHNKDGKAIVLQRRPAKWGRFDEDRLGMAVAYTTKYPADLNDDADVAAHDARLAQGPMSLVAKGGTLIRFVDFAPNYECLMHRTQSLDYGIVIEGEIIAVFDSGEEVLMRPGDIMVQRVTMHAWRNPSPNNWARMIFCLQDCKPLIINGKVMGEDLSKGKNEIPPSGNDA